jgi:hypothetical protein
MLKRDEAPNKSSIRRWLIRIGIALLVLEVVYLVGANAALRSGVVLDLINAKPERTHITWQSVTTYLPGLATVKGFELRSQSKVDQFSVRVDRARARIGLISLAFRTISIKGVDAQNVEFLYRQRLDRPVKPGTEEQRSAPPKHLEYWPEIAGFSNPPDPKPEEIYVRKHEPRPWTIKISGADVGGRITVALNAIRIEGRGTAGGSVTVKPKESISIRRGRLGLEGTRVTIGPEVVTEALDIDADVRIDTFPAKGVQTAEVLRGISGSLSVHGTLGQRAAVRHQITPGITMKGAGDLAMDLKLRNGIVRAPSEYSLSSDDFHLQVMDLEILGSAEVTGETMKRRGAHVSTSRIALGGFELVDPDDGSVDLAGEGLEINALWDELSVAGDVPAARVELVLPPTRIHDVSAFSTLIPEQVAFDLGAGSGMVEASLVVEEQVASGDLDLVTDDIVVHSGDTSFFGDLEVHAKMAEGDLWQRRFDLSGTKIRLDDIADPSESEKKQARLADWYLGVEVERAEVIFGKPMAANGRVSIEMHDTRPVMAMLRKLGAGPKWLSMAPNIKNVSGAADIGFDADNAGFDDLVLTGDGFEALGWMQVAGPQTDARLFARFKAVAAGVAVDEGKAKIIIAKPRKWFDDQPSGPSAAPMDR